MKIRDKVYKQQPNEKRRMENAEWTLHNY